MFDNPMTYGKHAMKSLMAQMLTGEQDKGDYAGKHRISDARVWNRGNKVIGTTYFRIKMGTDSNV